MPTLNEALRDRSIAHQIHLTRYTTQVVQKILALLNRADQDIIRRLRSRNLPGARTPYQRQRLEKLLAGIREINSAAYASFNRQLRLDLRELTTYEANFLTRQINAAILVDLEAVTPAVGLVYSAALSRPMQGKYLREWFSTLSANKGKAVSDAIRLGVVEGETIDQIVRRLRGTRAARYRNGIMSIHRRHAEAVTRTAVNHVVTNARRAVIDKNADLVKGWQYVATLDGRTTDICMSLDGQVYATREEGPTPPQHINCRSTITPVVKSWKELGFKKSEVPEGTRASMNGQVSAKETYQTWLKKQPAGFQNDVLGKTKAKLFREGGVTLDRFVDSTGRSYTLAELARREADAFAAIGGSGG